MKSRKTKGKGNYGVKKNILIPEQVVIENNEDYYEKNCSLLAATVESIERQIPNIKENRHMQSDFSPDEENRINELLRKLTLDEQLNDNFLVECPSLSSKVQALMKLVDNERQKQADNNSASNTVNTNSEKETNDVDIDEWLDNVL